MCPPNAMTDIAERLSSKAEAVIRFFVSRKRNIRLLSYSSIRLSPFIGIRYGPAKIACGLPLFIPIVSFPGTLPESMVKLFVRATRARTSWYLVWGMGHASWLVLVIVGVYNRGWAGYVSHLLNDLFFLSPYSLSLGHSDHLTSCKSLYDLSRNTTRCVSSLQPLSHFH